MIDKATVKHDALVDMWTFMQIGGQVSDRRDVEHLIEECAWMVKALTQKTAGQRSSKPNDVDWAEMEMHENLIILEVMALYLSGSLDKLKEILEGESDG
jgi:hypothetical protein